MQPRTSYLTRISLPALGAILIAFILTAGSTGAETAAACQGRDMLATIKASQPGLYGKIATEAAATLNGNARLWRIEPAGGGKASFLLGTFHLPDPRTASLNQNIRNILAKVDTIALEITGSSDRAKIQAELMKNPQLLVLQGAKDLWQLTDPADHKAIMDSLAAIGLGKQQAARLQPWLPATMLAVSACFADLSAQGHHGLDQTVETEAARLDKQVKGLETPVEQFSAMSSMPMDSQILYLSDAAKLRGQIGDLKGTLIQLYLSDRIGWILPFSNAVTAEVRRAERIRAEAGFIDALVTRRNKVMLTRALPLLRQGPTLIAVGALHLPGKAGLVALFAGRGFTVSPLEW